MESSNDEVTKAGADKNTAGSATTDRRQQLSQTKIPPKRRPKIAVLPRAVVDQIAAGEVVQRPVSVIKELLENSLDAGATQIVIQYDGLSKFSIADNGRGIPSADLNLLCTRHATSKLASVDDFSDLSTFGFRGEALASTSMVSRLLTVVTRLRVGEYDDDDESASVVAYAQSYQHGKPLQLKPKPCARKVGTTITVNDLFYNVHHRQKAFSNSKREAEEYGRIHKLIQDYAVHYPTVGFVCQRQMATRAKAKANKQLVVDCNTGQIPAVRALLQSRASAAKLAAAQKTNKDNSGQKAKVVEATKQILTHVLGSNLANHLLYMECSSSDNDKVPTENDCGNGSGNTKENADRYKFRYAAEIYFTTPTYNSVGGGGSARKGNSSKQQNTKTTQGKFVLFLNHRLVDLPPLKRALEDIYADLGNPNRSKSSTNNSNVGKPVLVVNLSIPGCQVDVNVHPSKRQVALMYQEDVIRDLAVNVKERLEDHGQAFLAQSVATPAAKKANVRNPYAKTPSSQKRKRSSPNKESSEEAVDIDDKEEIETMSHCENDIAEEKKRSKRDENFDSPPPHENARGKIDGKKRNPRSGSSEKKIAPSKLVRTNLAARAGAIEPFLVSTQGASQLSQSQSTQDNNDENDNPSSSQRPLSQPEQSSMVHIPPCPLANPLTLKDIDITQPGAFALILKQEKCTCPTDVIDMSRRTVFVPNTVVRPKRVVPTPSKYTSIASLRKRVGKQQCHETTKRIRTAFFMGVLSHQRSLVQCGEEMVMINHFELAKELFYQLALARFNGGAKLARLGGGGICVQTVVAQALQHEDELTLASSTKATSKTSVNNGASCSDMLQVNDSNQNLAEHIAARLVESSAMLEEYFSIRIELQPSIGGNDMKSDDNKDGKSDPCDYDHRHENAGNAILTGLPVLLDGHSPQPHALPIFLLRLATQVDWTREKHCFHGVCKEIGNFYAMLPSEWGDLNPYVQHTIFPALSYLLLPSKNQASNGYFTAMTKLSTLYKVFER
ncbi:unnamed protein product [Pseudo-nitzschia multistriata]|uniref:DNA mismatch repair protein S5 domain-containing protein n=1 Tax=Pseudo-nitzschia multistriata TaxID=183589 RepID=A0A448ZTE3_9STRA|nr:unnamed protein product [Pseudo-nitzschia multistriata]